MPLISCMSCRGTCFISEIQLNWIFDSTTTFAFCVSNTMPNRQATPPLHKGRRRKSREREKNPKQTRTEFMVGDEVEPELKPLNPTRKSFCVRVRISYSVGTFRLDLIHLNLFTLSLLLTLPPIQTFSIVLALTLRSFSSTFRPKTMAEDKIVTERSCTKKLCLCFCWIDVQLLPPSIPRAQSFCSQQNFWFSRKQTHNEVKSLQTDLSRYDG